MRIFRTRAAWILLQTSVIFGQLPYHTLKLVISNYELMQDAFQKLCRAGYLEVVKAPGHKSFFATDAGFETYCRMAFWILRVPAGFFLIGVRLSLCSIRQ